MEAGRTGVAGLDVECCVPRLDQDHVRIRNLSMEDQTAPETRQRWSSVVEMTALTVVCTKDVTQPVESQMLSSVFLSSLCVTVFLTAEILTWDINMLLQREGKKKKFKNITCTRGHLLSKFQDWNLMHLTTPS